MKTVYFIRHAKSSWKDASLSDIERPLNQRGKRDAPFMGSLLWDKGVQPDAIISSTAKRAYKTAGHFAKALGIEKNKIIREAAIYEAYATTVLDIVRRQPNDWRTILVFGHNPTFTTIANLFTDDSIYNVPTCGIVKVVADIDDWRAFGEATGRLDAYYYPKQFFI